MSKDEQIEKLIELCNKQQQAINNLICKEQDKIAYVPMQEQITPIYPWNNPIVYSAGTTTGFNPKNVTFTV